MADKKISDLTNASSLSASDYLEIENAGGNSRKMLASVMKTYVRWDFVPPAAADFGTTASGDATNVTLTDDSDVGLLVDSGTLVLGDKFRIAYKALPSSGNTDWEVKMRYKCTNPGANNYSVGIVAYESASGKACSALFQPTSTNSTCYFQRSASLGAWTATIGSVARTPHDGWLRFNYTNGSSTLAAYWSINGKQWQSLGSVTNATAFTTRADKVGISTHMNVSGGNIYMSVPYWWQSF